MYSLSPGAPRGVPGEGLSLCIVCLLVLREGCQGKACLPAGTPTMLCPLSLSSSSLCSDFPLNLSSFIFIFWKCLINSLELAVCYTGDTVIKFD